MTPEERSRALRAEADEMMEFVGLRGLCAGIGELVPTGSYFMDLMMYPDVDLHLPMTAGEKLLGVAVELGKLEGVERISYVRGGPGELEKGLYLKPVIKYGNWERPWKIDMWSLPSEVVEEKQAELADLKRRMTAEKRGIILDTKYQLLTEAGRTPMFSGIFIYRAVINEGMRELADIVEYLKGNGVEV